jgi:thymidylate synthase
MPNKEMFNVITNTIGQAWKGLVYLTDKYGIKLADEALEILDVNIKFKHNFDSKDLILEKYADKEMIKNMQKVFFSNEENSLGHSYFENMRTPYGNSYYEVDIVKILKEKINSKRATLTLNSSDDGKVPCINVIDFLIRNDKLNVYYFSRGQDAYKKFYADALVVATMQKNIAKILSIDLGEITGYIVSSHIYNSDLESIKRFLK